MRGQAGEVNISCATNPGSQGHHRTAEGFLSRCLHGTTCSLENERGRLQPPWQARMSAVVRGVRQARNCRSAGVQALARVCEGDFAKASLVVAGELAEVGVACRDRRLRHAVRALVASFDESITSEVEAHGLEVAHRRGQSKSPEAVVDRPGTHAANRNEVFSADLLMRMFADVVFNTTHIVRRRRTGRNRQ